MWAYKLYLDTYKTAFPEQVHSKLDMLPDMCNVEYHPPNNKNKVLRLFVKMVAPFLLSLLDIFFFSRQCQIVHKKPSDLNVFLKVSSSIHLCLKLFNSLWKNSVFLFQTILKHYSYILFVQSNTLFSELFRHLLRKGQ